jgi:hypothetical protein
MKVDKKHDCLYQNYRLLKYFGDIGYMENIVKTKWVR